MTMRYRPSIPLLVKYLAALRYAGLTPADVEFDHDPPLGLREYDEATRAYTPPANDPERIVMRIKADHRAKTNGPRGPHTSIDGDIHAIAKTKGNRAAKFQVAKPPLDDQPSAYCTGCETEVDPRQPHRCPAGQKRADERGRRLHTVHPPAARCRRCGEDSDLCTCPPQAPRSSFGRAR